MQKNLLNK